MILITSGAYLGPEFIAELGLLPPSFLPIGNMRLFQLQARELAGFTDPLFMSLPESFCIHAHDQALMDTLGINVVRVPEGLNLAESVLHALCTCPTETNDLRILHGDTLIKSLPQGLDIFTIGQTSAYFSWAIPNQGPHGELEISEGLSQIGQSREVLSGYFAFSNKAELVRALALSRGSFIRALNVYASKVGLALRRSGAWFDFGHLSSFHQSKASVTTQRQFNTLEINPATVVKTSSNIAKVEAEASWFESLPPSLRLNVPRFIRRTERGYELEYLYLCTLSELMVFGELPGKVWTQIMEACKKFLDRCREERAPNSAAHASQALYLPKTLARLEAFSRDSGLSLDHPWTINGIELPGLKQVARETAELIPLPGETDLCLTHGDLCFSNIFYDFRRQDIFVIDPRGQDHDGQYSQYGDIRYDIAKLYHSAAAGYDFIKANACILNINNKYSFHFETLGTNKRKDIQYAFLSKVIAPLQINIQAIKAINAHLFLSMLPLHSDDRKHQMAFLATGMTIYADLRGITLDETASDNQVAA